MIYVAINPQHAWNFSKSIQRLMRPNHLRDQYYVTEYYCPIITHPQDGRTCLELPETETIPIHAEADGQELSEILQIFVIDGSITQQEADQIVSAVQLLAGQQVIVADFIPPSWQQNVFTREQLQEEGWFPDTDL